jgi:hypothetical protein
MLLMLIMDDLDVTLRQWKGLPTWNPLAQTVIVFMDPFTNEEEKDINVRIVLEKLFEQGIIYANVLYQMKSNEKRMTSVSWFPYFETSCGKKVENIFKIDECNVWEEYDEIKKQNVLRSEIRNFTRGSKIPTKFHGCTIHVSVII